MALKGRIQCISFAALPLNSSVINTEKINWRKIQLFVYIISVSDNKPELGRKLINPSICTKDQLTKLPDTAVTWF